MPIHTQSTRLGDILVDRGVITRQQLREAIEIQHARHAMAEKQGIKAPTLKPLGEILIELGFINRRQLKQNLGWQSRLRKATLVMSFVAPLLTTACGGGGGGGSANPTGNNKPDSGTTSSMMQSSSVASSASSQASSTPKINGPVLLSWEVPSMRENGEALALEEIGGYELRYRADGGEEYTKVVIEGGYTDSYYFNHLEGYLQFEIAAYDTNGLYSRFIPIMPVPKG